MTTVRSAVWLGIVALAAAASFGLLVVLPYFVNDLDRFPLADVPIGYHDPKDLWPTTIPYIGGWLHLFGVLSTVFAPSTHRAGCPRLGQRRRGPAGRRGAADAPPLAADWRRL